MSRTHDQAAHAAHDQAVDAGQGLRAALPAIFAIALGAFIVLGVGFSHISVAHNAAHDTRHTLAFPCH